MVRFSDLSKKIYLLALAERAVNNIRRNGLRAFLRNSLYYRFHRFIYQVKFFFFCGADIFLPVDQHMPDMNKFLPGKPFSLSGLKGKPSVCLITSHLSAGGAERQITGLACALKKLGYDVRVRVLRLDGESGHYLPYLQAHGVDVSVPREPTFSDIKYMRQKGVDLSLIKYLPKEIRIDTIALTVEFLRRPVDLVHCYLDWCCCYGGFAALLSGVPAIRFSWRNANPTHFEFFIDWMPGIYKFLLQFPHVRVENNSTAGALDYAEWLELPLKKIEVMPNGVDTEWLSSSNNKSESTVRQTIGISPEAPVVVSTGRLVPQKRPFDLPDILFALRKKIPRALFIHIGDGPLRNDLLKLMARKGLSGSWEKKEADAAMLLLGRRENVYEILKSADVFLLTSAREGMPNVIMEAMLAGLPVVATRVGGVPDLIENGVHGYLHDVGDIAGMAQSLEQLLNDPVLRQKMGNAGRARILKEFTINHLVDRITRAYAVQCAE
jgi:glycosyltransferase involved in cell wall biosynthesis